MDKNKATIKEHLKGLIDNGLGVKSLSVQCPTYEG